MLNDLTTNDINELRKSNYNWYNKYRRIVNKLCKKAKDGDKDSQNDLIILYKCKVFTKAELKNYQLNKKGV